MSRQSQTSVQTMRRFAIAIVVFLIVVAAAVGGLLWRASIAAMISWGISGTSPLRIRRSPRNAENAS